MNGKRREVSSFSPRDKQCQPLYVVKSGKVLQCGKVNVREVHPKELNVNNLNLDRIEFGSQGPEYEIKGGLLQRPRSMRFNSNPGTHEADSFVSPNQSSIMNSDSFVAIDPAEVHKYERKIEDLQNKVKQLREANSTFSGLFTDLVQSLFGLIEESGILRTFQFKPRLLQVLAGTEDSVRSHLDKSTLSPLSDDHDELESVLTLLQEGRANQSHKDSDLVTPTRHRGKLKFNQRALSSSMLRAQLGSKGRYGTIGSPMNRSVASSMVTEPSNNNNPHRQSRGLLDVSLQGHNRSLAAIISPKSVQPSPFSTKDKQFTFQHASTLHTTDSMTPTRSQTTKINKSVTQDGLGVLLNVALDPNQDNNAKSMRTPRVHEINASPLVLKSTPTPHRHKKSPFNTQETLEDCKDISPSRFRRVTKSINDMGKFVKSLAVSVQNFDLPGKRMSMDRTKKVSFDMMSSEKLKEGFKWTPSDTDFCEEDDNEFEHMDIISRVLKPRESKKMSVSSIDISGMR
mmetsp:Transcript_65310/g.75087  ORF Transcript_65310/g.75087 Transcript_65310/m.75087 type:complete len:513 (-) Transcript_65310:303-1841(-)